MRATTTPAGGRLQAVYDDPDDPSELTVFPPGSDCPETCWMTMDVASAIPLENAR